MLTSIILLNVVILDVVVYLLTIRLKDLENPEVIPCEQQPELKNLDDFRDSRGLYVTRRR
jgi:hypothetical protein